MDYSLFLNRKELAERQQVLNHKHKCHQLNQLTEGHLKTSKDTRNFNFKKTTLKKYLYSCKGYGGRCGQCSIGGYDRQILKKSFENSKKHDFIN